MYGLWNSGAHATEACSLHRLSYGQRHAIKGGIEKGKEMDMIHPPCEAWAGAHANSGNIALRGSHWDISKLNVDHVSRCLLDMLFRLLSQRGSTFETQKS